MKASEFLASYGIKMSFDAFEAICNSIGIVVTSFDDVLSDADMNKLSHNTSFNNRVVNAVVLDTMGSMEQALSEMRSKYVKLLSDPNVHEADKRGLQEMLDRLEENYGVYKTEVDNLTKRNNRHGSVFTGVSKKTSVTTNKIAQRRINSLQGKMRAQDKKLLDQYKELNLLLNNGAKSKLKRIATARRMQRVNSRIASLQGKQGKIQTKQRRITERNSKRYIKRMQVGVQREQKSMDRELAYADKREAIETALKEYAHDKKESREELALLSRSKSLVDRLRVLSINKEIKRMDGKMNSLRKKRGKLYIKNQHARDKDNRNNLMV